MRLREDEFRELINLIYNHVHPLKEFAAAASVIVEHMFNKGYDEGRRFVLEDASAAENHEQTQRITTATPLS